MAQLLKVDAQSPQTLQAEVQSWAAQLEEVYARIASHLVVLQKLDRVGENSICTYWSQPPAPYS